MAQSSESRLLGGTVERNGFSGHGNAKSPQLLSTLVGLENQLMVPTLRSQDRMGAIKELVDRMHQSGVVSDSLGFLQSVLDREDLESTVLASEVAFPHARSRSVDRLSVAFGLSQEGVDFYSESHPQPVHLVCLLAVPISGAVKYLPLLGRLAGLFQQPGFRSGLKACSTSGEMFKYLS